MTIREQMDECDKRMKELYDATAAELKRIDKEYRKTITAIIILAVVGTLLAAGGISAVLYKSAPQIRTQALDGIGSGVWIILVIWLAMVIVCIVMSIAQRKKMFYEMKEVSVGYVSDMERMMDEYKDVVGEVTVHYAADETESESATE